MSIFWITLQAVATLLGIGVIGFWIIGQRQMPANALSLLSSIAIDIAIPCLILSNLISQFSPQTMPGWWHLPLWWVGFTVITLALSLVCSRLAKKETRREFAMSLFYQNGIFFPLVILSGLFFTDSAPYLVQMFLFIFLQASLVFATYPFFFRRKKAAPSSGQPRMLVWKRVINPVLVMTIAGLLITLTGIKTYVPEFIVTILQMIGAMAIPLFMLILGGNIYNDFVPQAPNGRNLYLGESLKFALVKNLLFPLVILGLLVWIHPDFKVALIIILEAAVPPITAVPLFAERSGGNRAITNMFVLTSFILSILSLPVIMYLFSRFFAFP